MNIQWDAKKYDRDFSFVPRHGAELISLLESQTAHTVLDLGCGNGTLTKALADEGFSVCGLDASEAQLELAKQSYPDISFVLGDATDFHLDAPVDAVFSNAVFHWIDRQKHPQMLACVYRALKEGGQFVFECGGYQNGYRIHRALRAAFEKRHLEYRFSCYFPTIGEYAALLEQAGFKVTYAALFDRPTPLKGETGLEDWIRMFLKEPFAGMNAALQTEIIDETVEVLRPTLFKNGEWIADYVRLRCKAIKCGNEEFI